MNKSEKIKLRMSIIVALSLLVVAPAAWAESLNPGEVYTSLDGKRTIEVISKSDLEITKGGDILLAQYNFRGGKLRAVYTSRGTKMVEYYQLTHDGLKDKDGNILYSKKGLATRKKLHNFFDVFKSAAMKRDVEKMRNLTHPSYLSSTSKEEYQLIINMYLYVFNKIGKPREFRIEDISNKELLEWRERGAEWGAVPEKRIVYFVGSGEGSGGGGDLFVASHKGEWKLVFP